MIKKSGADRLPVFLCILMGNYRYLVVYVVTWDLSVIGFSGNGRTAVGATGIVGREGVFGATVRTFRGMDGAENIAVEVGFDMVAVTFILRQVAAPETYIQLVAHRSFTAT